ncbi:TPA: hypothetical protein N0F65_003268 [Lagenidium giganteum]|uniref:VTT domain-containing protein n=1 Tax=Lagenidium giganteum TaxID=4803 RepID=A0AAV2YEV5_9STRA|nr:TPA: hypothetical protein N0F65_003268 [Lagenidium giganteum]
MGLGKVQLLATQRLRHWKDQSRAVRCRVRKYARPALYATLVAIALAVLVTVVPMKAIAASLVKWMQRHPTLGAFLIPVTLWVAIPLAIPSTIFEVLAGSLFGVIGGALISLAGKVGGAVIAFQLGKAIGRERVGNYLFKKFPSFRAICEVLQKSSWKPLLLLQVSSLPNALKCYGLAIVDISLFRFTVSTMIGGFPHAIMWGFVGNQARDVLTSGDGDGVRSRSSRTIFMVGGMVCTALAMGFLVYYTRKELLEMQTKVDHKADGDSDDDTTDLEDPHSPLVRRAKKRPSQAAAPMDVAVDRAIERLNALKLQDKQIGGYRNGNGRHGRDHEAGVPEEENQEDFTQNGYGQVQAPLMVEASHVRRTQEEYEHKLREQEHRMQAMHQEMQLLRQRLQQSEHQNSLLRGALSSVETQQKQIQDQELTINELQQQVRQLRATNYRLQFVVQQNEAAHTNSAFMPPRPPDIF